MVQAVGLMLINGSFTQNQHHYRLFPTDKGHNVEKEKSAKDGYFRRHRAFICGIISGNGLGFFSVEAFQSHKNPIVYIGSMFLIVLGSLLYRVRDDLK